MNRTVKTMPQTKEEKRHRVQFDFSPEAYERLKALQHRANVQTYADLVRNALRLYEWFLEHKDEDYRLALVGDDDKVREIELLF